MTSDSCLAGEWATRSSSRTCPDHYAPGGTLEDAVLSGAGSFQRRLRAVAGDRSRRWLAVSVARRPFLSPLRRPVHSPGSSSATPQSRRSRRNAPMSSPTSAVLTRRELFEALAAAGVGTAVFQRAVSAQAEKAPALT